MASNPPRNMSVCRPLSVEVLETRDVPTFGAFGGLSIAIGDVIQNGAVGPGNPAREYITGTGPGVEGRVRIWETSGRLLRELTPFPGFTGGLNVAVGDVNNDGNDDIIVAPAAGGGPVVQVYNADGSLFKQFLAYEVSFRGGVTLASGNVDGVPGDEIVTGSGNGGGPVVNIFSVLRGGLVRQKQILAYEPTFRGGVNVAVADTDLNPTRQEIITGVGNGGGPLVKVFTNTGSLLLSFFAFDPFLRTGVTIAAGNTESTPGAEIFTYAPGQSSEIRVFDGRFGFSDGSFFPFPANYTNTINMAIGDVNFDLRNDLAVVAGEGPVFQQPRLFFGGTTSPAGFNGP
ncbi:MAG TPA: hypothetical protein VKE74_25225 [Gemmataceae bacterium]|nr:hypothetical protein [Gemmataceae bacterium]